MALDPTARESNFRDSLKDYLIDNVETTEGISLSFDKALSSPDLQGKAVHTWVGVVIDAIHLGTMSEMSVRLFCCTRQDNEGFKLAQLRDKVMGYFVNDGTVADGQVRIPFYRSMPIRANWISLGSLLVQDIFESGQMEAPDETKYKIITVRLRTPSKM